MVFGGEELDRFHLAIAVRVEDPDEAEFLGTFLESAAP